MKFSDEYKREMRAAEPDGEALARMKAAVMKAVQQEKPKNALPFSRRLALFGGSAAACALIAVCAVKLAPLISKTDKITTNETLSYASCAEDTAAEITMDAAADFADADKSGGHAFAEDCTAADEGGLDASSPAFDVPIFSQRTDDAGSSEAADELPLIPEGAETDIDFIDSSEICAPVTTTAKNEPDLSVAGNGAPDKLPDIGAFSEPEWYTEESVMETDEWDDAETECETECITECTAEETWDVSSESEEIEEESAKSEEVVPNDGGVNAEMFGEGYLSTVIEISADGRTVWVYGDGEHKSKGRYMRVSTAERGGDELPSVTLLNTADGLQYLVKLRKGAPNCIYITDSAGNFLGKYRKNG